MTTWSPSASQSKRIAGTLVIVTAGQVKRGLQGEEGRDADANSRVKIQTEGSGGDLKDQGRNQGRECTGRDHLSPPTPYTWNKNKREKREQKTKQSLSQKGESEGGGER